MRLAHLRRSDGIRLGLDVGDGRVLRLDAVAPDVPSTALEFLQLPRPDRDRIVAAAERAVGSLAERLAAGGALCQLGSVALAAPVVAPPKILCLALNYRSHAEEGGFEEPARPVVFLKGPNSLIGHDDEIVVPAESRRIDHEGELAVVIGRRARHVQPGEWRNFVAGYTIMNDLTARDWQLEDIANRHPWDLTKSFDGYGPTGPWLVTPDEVPDPQALDLQVRVGGDVRQSSSTAQMIFGVEELLVRLSRVLTLEPGDLIATGTCDGIGPVGDGEVVEVEIGDLGTLRNTVRFAPSAGESVRLDHPEEVVK